MFFFWSEVFGFFQASITAFTDEQDGSCPSYDCKQIKRFAWPTWTSQIMLSCGINLDILIHISPLYLHKVAMPNSTFLTSTKINLPHSAVTLSRAFDPHRTCERRQNHQLHDDRFTIRADQYRGQQTPLVLLWILHHTIVSYMIRGQMTTQPWAHVSSMKF